MLIVHACEGARQLLVFDKRVYADTFPAQDYQFIHYYIMVLAFIFQLP